MDKEKLLEVAARLDEISDWAGGEVEVGITLTHEGYYFDLGAFGEQSTYVEINDEYYPFEIERVMEHAPWSVSELASDIREVVNATEVASLDAVLAQMAASGAEQEQRLARVLMAVADALRESPTGAPSALPAKPLPWPGAMRTDIDYTADDFPLRYQPPPGYDWGGTSTVAYDSVVKKECEAIRSRRSDERGEMVLDNKGRVSWILSGDDDLADDKGRWPVWFHERDGFPEGNGSFTAETKPLALDADGVVIGEWKDCNDRTAAWQSDSDAEIGVRRAREIREEFAGAPPVEKPKEEFAPPEPVTL